MKIHKQPMSATSNAKLKILWKKVCEHFVCNDGQINTF